MNTQYRKNLKAVLEASKTYCDESIDSLKWELGTYDLSVGSDTTSAYQKVVPANSIEAKINTLGGMSYKCNNLYSGSQSVSATGQTFEAVILTNPITLSSGTYKMSATTTAIYPFIGFYDNDNNLIDEFFMSGTLTLNSSATVKTIRFYYDGNGGTSGTFTFTDIMLNEGSTALPYEPYYSGFRDTAPTSIKSVGFNIWDEEVKNGYYSQGVYTNVSGSLCSKNPIEVIGGSTYYFYYGVANMPYNVINEFDSNMNFIKEDYYYPNSTYQVSANCSYITFNIPNAYGTTYNHDICINISNVSLNGTYKPYFTASLLIPAQVQALDGYGWGLNNAPNYIDFNAKLFVKKCDKDFTYRSLTTETDSVSGNTFYKVLLDTTLSAKSEMNGNQINNLDIPYNYAEVTSSEHLYIYDTLIIVFVSTSRFVDSTACASYFTNDFEMLYELATPVETDISAYLTTNKITVEGGGTLTMENTYGASVPSDIDYLKEVAK